MHTPPPVKRRNIFTDKAVICMAVPLAVLFMSAIILIFGGFIEGEWEYILLALIIAFGLPWTIAAALQLSAIAYKKIKETSERSWKIPYAGLGIILWISALSIFVLAFSCVKEGIRLSACTRNLKQLGHILALYSQKGHKSSPQFFGSYGNVYEKFPPIDNIKNNFIFESDALFPEFLQDVSITACPNDSDLPTAHVSPSCIADKNYIYLGWMIMSDEEAETFFEAYDGMSPEDYDKDIIVPEGRGNVGGNVLYRLALGVDRFLITDINSMAKSEPEAMYLPIIWERPPTNAQGFTHRREGKPGGNVLYLDGHVEFIEYGKFPMTETMARLFEEHPREPIPDCEE